MPKTRFDELYGTLNSEQRQAVDAIEGPVMVIAGPGTGKTSILTLRIANILKQTDTSASSILALTFTESGVHSMRKKLVEIIGPEGYRVNIHTFHNFCNEIIKSYPQEFPRIIGGQHMSDLDQIAILEEIISKTKLKNLKPYGNPFFYLKSILSQIKEMKREDIDPKEFKKILQGSRKKFESISDLLHKDGVHKGEIRGKYKPLQRKIENSEELSEIYVKYQKTLENKRLYDYEDMIMEVLRELRKNKNLLLELEENYQYILADEHQDANNAQNKLLELLSGFHESPNLFIVGDEKQAIFRFQGASLENFLYFKKRFKDAVLITLKKNYRSSQKILDASHSLITKNLPPKMSESSSSLENLHVRLESVQSAKQNAAHPPLSVVELPGERAEYEYVASLVAEKIKNGIAPHTIAILYRDNKDALPLKRACEARGVPYVIHSDTDLIADDDIRAFIAVLAAVNDFGNDEKLSPILFFDFFKLDHLDVFKLFKASRRTKKSVYDLMSAKKSLVGAGVKDAARLHEIYKKLHALSVIAKKKNLTEAFEAVMNDTGFIGHLLSAHARGQASQAEQKLALFNILLSQVVELVERHKHYTLADYMLFLEMLTRHGVSIRAPGFSSAVGKVNLMTAHKSKGLEFDYVFCLHLNDGHWGNRKMPNYFISVPAAYGFPARQEDEAEDIEDERRLLYVALTRARKEITLTYARRNDSGRELLPSQLLAEIDSKEMRRISIEDEKAEKRFGLKKSTSKEKKAGLTASITDKKYLGELFLEEGLSVSALNNYLVCPWQFFFLNLIRIPKALERHQLYGTAIHETLKVFFDKYRENKAMPKKEILSLFENFLNRKALSQEDFKLFLGKGTKSLSGYFETYKSRWPKPIANELNISSIFLPFADSSGKKHNLLLKGILDKIEPNAGGSVTVVDYKTGNPKSRRDIEGATKSSEGNYKRQLVFYKFLLDQYEKGRYRMTEGTIDFIEPDKGGRYKKETFEILPEEVASLEKEISRVAKEIFEIEFWGKTCDDVACGYCKLRESIVGGQSTKPS